METNLPMSSLDLSEHDLDVAFSKSPVNDDNNKIVLIKSRSQLRPRRSLRVIRSMDECSNRRVLNKPKKLSSTNSLNDAAKYYKCTKVKRLPPTAETIYEEPKEDKNGVQLMSVKKFRRTLDFVDDTSSPKRKEMKKKKRLMKVKKVVSLHRINRRKKLSLDMLLNKLAELDEQEN